MVSTAVWSNARWRGWARLTDARLKHDERRADGVLDRELDRVALIHRHRRQTEEVRAPDEKVPMEGREPEPLGGPDANDRLERGRVGDDGGELVSKLEGVLLPSCAEPRVVVRVSAGVSGERAEGGDVGVGRAEEPEVDTDLGARALDRERLVPRVGRLEERALLRRAKRLGVVAVLERARAEVGQGSTQGDDFAPDVREEFERGLERRAERMPDIARVLVHVPEPAQESDDGCLGLDQADEDLVGLGQEHVVEIAHDQR